MRRIFGSKVTMPLVSGANATASSRTREPAGIAAEVDEVLHRVRDRVVQHRVEQRRVRAGLVVATHTLPCHRQRGLGLADPLRLVVVGNV